MAASARSGSGPGCSGRRARWSRCSASRRRWRRSAAATSRTTLRSSRSVRPASPPGKPSCVACSTESRPEQPRGARCGRSAGAAARCEVLEGGVAESPGDLVEQLFDAFNERSEERIRALCGEQVEFTAVTAEAAGRAGPYVGQGGPAGVPRRRRPGLGGAPRSAPGRFASTATSCWSSAGSSPAAANAGCATCRSPGSGACTRAGSSTAGSTRSLDRRSPPSLPRPSRSGRSSVPGVASHLRHDR